jgi:hypothetical protein
LAHLSGWSSLQRLRLRQTAITDVGLGYLEHMPHLMSLDIEETKTSNTAVGKYRQSHPRMLVAR